MGNSVPTTARFRRVRTGLRLALSLGVLLLAFNASADERAEQLERTRARLKALQSEINATTGQRDAVREQIHDLERNIGDLSGEQRETGRRLQDEQGRLDVLRAQAAVARRSLERQREDLARQIRAQYAMGEQEQLKLLLNQHDLALTSRMLVYYRYLHQARLQRMRDIEITLADIRPLEQRVEAKQQDLLTLRNRQRKNLSELESSRQRRSVLLASLDRRVTAQTREAAQLREDEARLARLLTEIDKAFSDAPMLPVPKGAFGSLKGKLSLPTRGRITARFGESKSIGNLKWRGLFVMAPEGQPVRAVARGRVAYADWLRGFGLLLILEHGDGYMTLYGHNQSLQKQVGEQVDAGDVISRIGTTGDAPQPGLYFEIRQNGEPRDPLLWVRAR